jgi:hypothetical protein
MTAPIRERLVEDSQNKEIRRRVCMAIRCFGQAFRHTSRRSYNGRRA